jgi:hypothetical protein
MDGDRFFIIQFVSWNCIYIQQVAQGRKVTEYPCSYVMIEWCGGLIFALTVWGQREREIKRKEGCPNWVKFLPCAMHISWFLPSTQTLPEGCRPLELSFELSGIHNQSSLQPNCHPVLFSLSFPIIMSFAHRSVWCCVSAVGCYACALRRSECSAVL